METESILHGIGKKPGAGPKVRLPAYPLKRYPLRVLARKRMPEIRPAAAKQATMEEPP